MRKTRLSLPRQVARRMKGRVNFYFDTKRNTVIARKWPRKRPSQHPNVETNMQTFANVVAGLTKQPAEISDFAKTLSKGTDYLWRDILMMAAYGKLVTAFTSDGEVFIGGRVAQPWIMTLLDSISNVTGAMLVRASDGWAALTGGTAGQVLVINDDGLPDFQDADFLPSIASGDLLGNISGEDTTPVGIGLAAFFDAVFGTSGADAGVLVRNGSTWAFVAAGADGTALLSTGTDTAPDFAAVTVSPAQNMPSQVQATTTNGWTMTCKPGLNITTGSGHNGTYDLPTTPADGDVIKCAWGQTSAADVGFQFPSGIGGFGKATVSAGALWGGAILMQAGYEYTFTYIAAQSKFFIEFTAD